MENGTAMDVIDFEEKRLEKLPAREFSRRLMSLPAKQRLNVILQREDIEEVIAALPAQDFYFSVQEIGPEDALPLLAYAKVEQLNHLFDIEWWQKDRVMPSRAIDWLERLSRASEEKFLTWLYHVDFDLLVTLFKQWVQVAIPPEDIDLVEAREQLPENTLDDTYYWNSLYPQYEDFIKRIFSLVFELNYGFYKELMNHIIWAIDVEVEENAYHFHRARLEDEAIPDFYDSLEIYRSIRPEEISYNKESLLLRKEEVSPPSFAIALLPQGDLLSRALQQTGDPVLLDTLQMELASIANKVVVADELAPDNWDSLRQGVDKTAAYINLGLDMTSSADLGHAVAILREVFLEHLFRLGQAQVAALRSRMQRLLKQGWPAKWPQGLKCLDSEWMESAELLLRKTPRLLMPYPRTLDPEDDLFRSRQDLFKGKQLVDVFISLGIIFDALSVEPDEISEKLWQQGQVRGLGDVTIGAMVWTAAARSILEGRWAVEPISVSLWPRLFSLMSPSVLKETIWSWLGKAVPDQNWRTLAEIYLSSIFDAYVEEMAPFGDSPPDPKLVKLFMFTQ
jgi:hypothetical protein